MPQRRALAGAAPGQQQRAGRAFAEPGGEQGGAADLVRDDLSDLTLVEGDIGGADRRLVAVQGRVGRGERRGAGVLRRVLRGVEIEEVQAHHVRVGQSQHDAVVGMHDLRVHAVPLGEPGTEGERPRGVHLGAEGRVHDDAPVAQLVAETLDEDGPVVGDVATGPALFVDVRQHVVHGPGIEAGGQQPLPGVLGGQPAELAQEGAQRTPQLQRTAQLVALPERQPPGNTGGGRHQDPVAGDVLDPPGRGAQREDVTDPGLVHHLLVQLTDPATALLGVGARQEDPEEPAVGDGASGGDGEPLRAGAARDRAGDPVPDDAGTQFGEGIGRIAAGEHVEHGGERRLGQRGEGGGPSRHRQQVVHLPAVQGDHRHQLLGQYVQGVGRDPQRLDGSGAHPLGDHGRLHQIAPVLREDDPGGDRAHLVPGTADPLQSGSDRRRGLHLDHQVDGPHVDPQLQAGRGDHRGKPARLEILLDLGALLLGDRSVVGPGEQWGSALRRTGLRHDLGGRVGLRHRLAGGPLVGDLVEPVAEPLRETAGVGEDDGGAVGLDEVGDPLLHMRPDRRLVRLARGVRVGGGGAAELAQVLDRHDHGQIELLGGRRLDDLHLPLR